MPFLTWFPMVNRVTLRADVMAALTGAVVVLPQGVAFAIIAGLPPEYGLYTAIVLPIVAALFGSSWHVVSGPSTPLSIIVFATVSKHAEPETAAYVGIALTLTFLAGIYQLAFGIARLGRLVNFISHSVVIGFTGGAGVLIITSQVKNVLGLLDVPRTDSFIHAWIEIFRRLATVNLYAAVVGGVTLVTAILLRRYFRNWPFMLIAMILGSLLSLGLDGPAHGIDLLGEIPSHLPPLSLPDLSLNTLRDLAPEGLAIAVLGLVSTISIARSIAIKTHQRIDSNQEFIGQGLSNLVGCFFSSYAGSGSFNRSGVNYEAGAKTPLAAILGSLFLVLILLVVAPLTAYLPTPVMAATIIIVGWGLIDFKHMRAIIRTSRQETAVLAVTMAATLLLDLEFAILAGVFLSLVLYLNRSASPRIFSIVPAPGARPRRFVPVASSSDRRCPQLDVLDVNGTIFFGSVDSVIQRLYDIHQQDPAYKHVLLIANSVENIDVSGAEMLADEAETWRERGGGLYISGLRIEDKVLLKRTGYLDVIGRDNIFHSKKLALPTVIGRLDPNVCATCSRRIFNECPPPPEAPRADPRDTDA